VAERGCHGAYNKWVVLALEIFSFVFWLCATATLTAYRVTLGIGIPDYVDSSGNTGYWRRDVLGDLVYPQLIIGAAVASAIQTYIYIRRPVFVCYQNSMLMKTLQDSFPCQSGNI
jgi:hypothetical protein